jgi:hypothetical protein
VLTIVSARIDREIKEANRGILAENVSSVNYILRR